MTYARNWIEEWRRAEAEGPILSALPPAKTAKSAKSLEVEGEPVPFGSFGSFGTGTKAATENGSTYLEWRGSIDALDASRPPMNFPGSWWRGLIREAELFVSVWGNQAANLGWTTLDLFGAHRKAPAANFSCMGLLLVISSGRVVVLTTEAAKIEQQSGARLTYTRRPPETECVAVWDLKA
jgi:hypothetical protein